MTELSGRLLDANDAAIGVTTPIVGAPVALTGTGASTTSDANGDFLFSDVNRFGGGIGNTLLGPVLGIQLDQATRLTVGNLQELIKEGEARGAGRKLIRFAQLMTPGRSL